jgi:hypothetical protein
VEVVELDDAVRDVGQRVAVLQPDAVKGVLAMGTMSAVLRRAEARAVAVEVGPSSMVVVSAAAAALMSMGTG